MELFAGLLPVLFLMLGDAPSLHLKEYERLQGVWVVRSAEYCFALADNDSPVGSTFTFEGKHVTISHWGRVYTVEINPSARPKEMDLVRLVDDAGNKEAELCIYEIDETQLKIRFGGYREKHGYCLTWRPADFTNPRQPNLTYVLERRKH